MPSPPLALCISARGPSVLLTGHRSRLFCWTPTLGSRLAAAVWVFSGPSLPQPRPGGGVNLPGSEEPSWLLRTGKDI